LARKMGRLDDRRMNMIKDALRDLLDL
jgi:mRNA-degrading endonuclease toxin of MazEF toxin-antitoxin module